METIAISSSQLTRAIVSVKKQIKYCINRRDDGMPTDALRITYRKLYGLDIPTLELGYKSLYQLVEDTPEIKVTRDPAGHPVLRVVVEPGKPLGSNPPDDNNNNEVGNRGAMGAALGQLIKETLCVPQRGIVPPGTESPATDPKLQQPDQVPVAVEAKEELPQVEPVQVLDPAKVLRGPRQPTIRAKKVGRATKIIGKRSSVHKKLRSVTAKVSGRSTRPRKPTMTAGEATASSNLSSSGGSEIVAIKSQPSKFSKKSYALPSKIAKRKNCSLPAGVSKTGLNQPRNRSGNFHIKRSVLGNSW